jgi:predicted nucleic acid-binding protein
MARMKGKFVLDTNIIIDHLEGLSPWGDFLNGLRPSNGCISVMTRMELLAWKDLDSEGERRVRALLKRLSIAPLSPEIEAEAIALRRKTRLKIPDAIITATAVISDAMLVTKDKAMRALNWPNLKVIDPTLFFS